MLVSHEKKFIYLKTIKTAGTSIEVALQKYCAPAGKFAEITSGAVETRMGIIGARGTGVKKFKWFNHMSAEQVRAQLPGEVWDGYRKICNIRNPWDKTVSFFHFQFREVKTEGPEVFIGKFRDWLPNAKGIGQDTEIYFIDGKPVADDYIRYDRLEADYAAVCEKLGIAPEPLPQLKTGERGQNKTPYQEYYTDELRDMVARAYDKEIQHFGWTFD